MKILATRFGYWRNE